MLIASLSVLSLLVIMLASRAIQRIQRKTRIGNRLDEVIHRGTA